MNDVNVYLGRGVSLIPRPCTFVVCSKKFTWAHSSCDTCCRRVFTSADKFSVRMLDAMFRRTDAER